MLVPECPSAQRSPTARLGHLLWLAMGAVLIGAVWWVAMARDQLAWSEAQSSALNEASAAAQAYEQYVTRSIAQMDQVSMQLKQSWEASRGQLRLPSLTREGMFLNGSFQSVYVIGADGRVISSTQGPVEPRSFTSDAFFAFHRNNNSSALTISTPEPRSLVQGAVLFSRRLETGDDEFAGVVVVTVPAHYFTSFYIPSALGQQGNVAMLGADGPLRLERLAPGAQGRLSPFTARSDIRAASSGAAMSGRQAGTVGGEADFLGWRHSSMYPVIALVALSHAEAMLSAQRQKMARHDGAAIISAALAFFALLASILTWRAARRTGAQEAIRIAYRAATENANDGFYLASAIYDGTGAIVDFEMTDCNERGAYFYGLTRASLIGMRLSQLQASDYGAALLSTYQSAMATGFHEDERELPDDPRLNIKWGQRRMVRVGDGLAITMRDIGERKLHLLELERLANEDVLTGLPNRQWLMQALPAAIALAREKSTQLALLFIDLDEFKQVNDGHGHVVGDLVLKAAAGRLRALLRQGDRVVRFGGDEFIVLMAPADSDAAVAKLAERIIHAFKNPFHTGSGLHEVGASVGISLYPRDGADAAALIKEGDIAMYAAKTEGKGQYRFYVPELSRTLQHRIQIKHDLIEAIAKNEFVLYYQPRVDTLTGELCSMEALIRWIHPVRGMIAPLDFIPLAETSGLIVQIGEIVMDKACRQIAAWRQSMLEPVPVSINVSPKQFERGQIHRQLGACLQRYAIPAHLLEVEITESAMLGEQGAVLAQLQAIRALGIKLHVDDFGTGYSSLSQLQKLKMDVLKVDRAFTAELGNSREGRVFFQAIVSMAHALGMSVVAEGVETSAQLTILQELGCNEVQGYLLARPLPAEAVPALLRQPFLLSHALRHEAEASV